MAADRGQFSSKLGFILAAAGSAVGLGNLAAFPVGAAKNGGAAFLLIYLIFVAFICYPVMMAEMSMGRKSKKNPVGAFKDLSGNDSFWTKIGMLGVITPFMIAVFYLVLTVWVFEYFIQTVLGNLDMLSQDASFGKIIADPSLFFYTLIVVGITFYILKGGVKDGIEKTAKILMPTLAVMMVLLAIFVLTLDNAFKGIEFYLVPDFSKINSQVVSSALSQAFFSLSLGMGILITYGSYLRKEDDIADSAKLVAITDSAIAFFAGLVILPAIFSFNPNIDGSTLSESSVGLIFSFLPKVFISMQATVGYAGASIVAGIFFLLVFFAAITSLVSILEVPIAYFVDEKEYKREKSLSTVTILFLIFGAMCTVSFGMVDFFSSMWTYGGAETKSFFDYVYDMFYETILPFIGFTVCIFTVRKWKMSEFTSELNIGNPSYEGSSLHKYVDVSLKTYIPAILFIVFLIAFVKIYFGVDLVGLLF